MDIVKKYEELEGLLRGHFLLSSGLHSDTYLQSEKVFMYPNAAEEIVKPLTNKLKDLEFDTIASPAIGGIRFGYELARQMKKKSIFTERVDNVMSIRRGFTVAKGERFVIAEDVVTTGKSTKECIEAIQSAGGVIVAVTSIIDRSSGTASFCAPYIPLVSVDVQTWSQNECPLCKQGGVAIKPGSRKF